ncbi:MAG: hypothetical protein AMXMBFR34_17950 [Myxococcaceae bacterium]
MRRRGLVAFSCKGRGWCPSCTTRRALDTGAHLESVLPVSPTASGRLSLAMGFHVVKQPALLERVASAMKASSPAAPSASGSTKGSSLQLTPHLNFHPLVPEAL